MKSSGPPAFGADPLSAPGDAVNQVGWVNAEKSCVRLNTIVLKVAVPRISLNCFNLVKDAASPIV